MTDELRNRINDLVSDLSKDEWDELIKFTIELIAEKEERGGMGE